ncbi:MAG: class I SAM-dependent methyltransferase [Actinobacteria bacterium]|nr:class I SAM-dependent methyltransferase [Actinomycetota bacterium]
MGEPQGLVASGYDSFYASWGDSPTLRAIWPEHVTGSDFPERFAHISFLRLAELASLRDALDLAAGSVFANLACDAGGTGLWVAQQAGADLIEIDLSATAVQRAGERVAALGLTGRATFRQGTFEATGFEDGAIDAAMSVDAIQYAQTSWLRSARLLA